MLSKQKPDCIHGQGISADRIRYLFEEHWVNTESEVVAAPEVEVSHYFGTRPISWMGPMVAQRRMSPLRDFVQISNHVDVKCQKSETANLILENDCRASLRGSRAEHLYQEHWLCSKEKRQCQQLIGTRHHTISTKHSKGFPTTDLLEQRAVQTCKLWPTISELGSIVEVDAQSLYQSHPLESEDSMNDSYISLVKNEDEAQRVGQRLSVLESDSIEMQADLVVLAQHRTQHGTVRYSQLRLSFFQQIR